MNISNLIKSELHLNKDEKIILEYLLNFVEINHSRYLKIPLNDLRNDLDIIENINKKFFTLSTKKISFIDRESGIITFCFNIIDSYSLIENYLLIIISDQIYELLSNEQTIFHVYSLLFQNKYTLSLFKELNRENSNFLISVEELKERLDLSDSYERLYDFERKILKNCVDEINSYTSLCIDYEKIYSKRKNDKTKLKFSIKKDENRNLEYHDNYKKSYEDLLNKFRSIYNF